MSVTSQWQSLVGVLRNFAPATAESFRPGASPRDIDAAQSALGVTFTAELVEWFSLQNGQADATGGGAGELLEHQTFFSLEELIAEHVQLLALSTEIANDNPDTYRSIADIAANAPRAGTATNLFIPAYIPISGFQGVDNLVDTRPGAQTGCVTSWAYESGEAGDVLWPSIEAMLAEIEQHIVNGPPEGWVIHVENGGMHWEVDTNGRGSTPTNIYVDQGFADNPEFVVVPQWPDYDDIVTSLSQRTINILRSHNVPREQSVDLIAVQQAVIDDAAIRYAPGRVTSVAPHGMYGGFSLPREPGAQLTILVGIDGELKSYNAIATDRAGGFRIEAVQ